MTQRFGSFSNPIIGGDGTLIREAIRSPNYVPGVSGWTINKDGTASFNSTTINGSLQVIGANGSIVWIRDADDFATIEIYPPVTEPALVPGEIQGRAIFPDLPTLTMFGPTFTGFSRPSIELRTNTTIDEAYLGFEAQRYSIGAPFGKFTDSIAVVNVENMVLDTTRVLANADIRSTLLPYSLTSAWIGFSGGQMVERDGAGNTVATRRFEQLGAVTTASAVYVENLAAPTEGIAFRCGATGNHRFQWAAGLGHSVANGATLVSWELRLNSVIGSGAVVLAASDDRAIENNGGNRQYGSFYEITGLTPGLAYNIRLMYRSGSGASATIIRRRMSITPILY